MRLKDRMQTPVGGFQFLDDESGRVIQTDGSFDRLVAAVRNFYLANNRPVPEKLEMLIEDQICTRQPPGKCYYTKGFGDQISRGIHVAARVVDKVAGTNLETRARRCGGCSKRRTALN